MEHWIWTIKRTDFSCNLECMHLFIYKKLNVTLFVFVICVTLIIIYFTRQPWIREVCWSTYITVLPARSTGWFYILQSVRPSEQGTSHRQLPVSCYWWNECITITQIWCQYCGKLRARALTFEQVPIMH